MKLPKRKAIRLPEYDYSSPGAYFITICTRDRRCILWDNAKTIPSPVGAAISRPQNRTVLPVPLSDAGRIVDQAIRNIPLRYPHISIGKYVVMPNHVHLILRITAEDGGRLIAAPTISTVIGQMKRWASRQSGCSLWQKSFYEHVIRNEADYRETWDYIDGNPAKRAEDEFYTE